jgi:hypothetical protein
VPLERDIFPERKLGRSLLGVVAVGLALLKTVDPAETDAFGVLVVQDFAGVAVNCPDYPSSEVGS